MLSGKFLNCYGIKDFDMKEIEFSFPNNSAIIYAPNGVMKTSFANVFRDISQGLETKDRIFKELQSSYSINYYSSNYTNTSLSKRDNIYVVQSIDDTFIPANESLGILLADEKTRKEYDVLMNQISGIIEELCIELSNLSGIKKQEIEKMLKKDLNMKEDSDWYDILFKLKENSSQDNIVQVLSSIKYSEILNEKTEAIIVSSNFSTLIKNYINSLNEVLSKNEYLSRSFNDYNADDLGKSLKKNNLFANNHTIVLNDGTVISSFNEWNSFVEKQMNELYKDESLSKSLKELTKKLTGNENVRRFRDIISANPSIIPYLSDISNMKKLFWITYINNLENGIEHYFETIQKFSERIKELYETANQQSERWNKVVSEFNKRFKVPFEVKIKNKANILLKDEAPNLYFEYSRGKGTNDVHIQDCKKEELLPSLSMGEKRALYLLYVIFDIEMIKKKACEGSIQYLIILDDIADSFDYKNKYAIIEYMDDIKKNDHIDLLVLTHNFDFYRTVASRLNISSKNCYIVQKDENDILNMNEFSYKNDYFKKGLLEPLKSDKIDSDDKKIKLISSIPFFRNIAEYMSFESEYDSLTCFLHVKKMPMDTEKIKLSDLWSILCGISSKLNKNALSSYDENYIVAVRKLANNICNMQGEEVSLENKIVLSIAIRLELELFLKQILNINNISLDCSGVQTRVWSNLAKPFLTSEQVKIVDEVNIMTPEHIHVNSFMYEPILDMDIVELHRLYHTIKNLI